MFVKAYCEQCSAHHGVSDIILCITWARIRGPYNKLPDCKETSEKCPCSRCIFIVLFIFFFHADLSKTRLVCRARAYVLYSFTRIAHLVAVEISRRKRHELGSVAAIIRDTFARKSVYTADRHRAGSDDSENVYVLGSRDSSVYLYNNILYIIINIFFYL